MSRLDQHVAAVQNKLALGRFFHALAWTTLGFAAACWIAILIDRAFSLRLPQQRWFFWGGAGLAVALAIIEAMLRRPSPQSAAIAIDEKLKLKEKISTALFVRGHTVNDPFAAAALRDAEQTAQNVVVNFRQHFPFHFPRVA